MVGRTAEEEETGKRKVQISGVAEDREHVQGCKINCQTLMGKHDILIDQDLENRGKVITDQAGSKERHHETTQLETEKNVPQN